MPIYRLSFLPLSHLILIVDTRAVMWRCYKNSPFLLRFILRYQSMVLYGNYDRYRVPRKSPKRARGERPSPGRPPWGISTAPPSTGICQIGQSHLTVLSSTTRLLSCTSKHVFSFALFPSVYRSRRNVFSLSLPLLPPQDVRPTEVCIRRNGTLHDPQLALFARSLFQEM